MSNTPSARDQMISLIEEVKKSGITINATNILRMHSVVSATPLPVLEHLATGEDEFGTPPQTEKEKTEVKARQTALFTILFYVWGWEKTVSFYLRYTAPQKKQNKQLRETNASLQAEINLLKSVMRKDNAALEQVNREKEKLEETVQEQAEEIIRLKARLFDAIKKGETENEK